MALLPSNIPANNRVPRKYQNASESSKDPNVNAAVDGGKGKKRAFEVETTDSASDSNGGNVGSSESEWKKPRLSLVPYMDMPVMEIMTSKWPTRIDCLLIFLYSIYLFFDTNCT